MRAFLLALILVTPSLAQSGASRPVAVLRQQAGMAIRQHHYQQAVTILDKLISAHPRDASLWTLKGMALDGLNKTSASLASFDKALAVAPTYLPALEGAAQIAYLHKTPTAAKYVHRLLAVYPQSKVANAMAGALDYLAGKCISALPYFQRSASYLFQSPNGTSEYADCLLRRGVPRQAVTVLQEGLQRHPQSVKLKYNLAVVELQAHQPEQAVATLAPLADSGDSGLLNLLASAYNKAGRPDEAFAALEKAIRLSPNAESNYLDLAILCLDHNRVQCSVQAASAGIARLSRPTSLYLIRGVAYGQLAEYAKAKQDFDTAARLTPGQPHSAIAMSLLYAARDNPAKQKQWLTHQLKLTPHNGVANYLMANLLISSGAEPGQPNFASAKAHLKESLRVDPYSAEAQILMGKMLQMENNQTAALAHLQQALKIAPNNRAALFQAFLLMRKLHRTADAAQLLKRLKVVINSQMDHPAKNRHIRLAR